MTKLERIEKDIQTLEAAELAHFRQWFAVFDAKHWDAQFGADALAGKLDGLADRAIEAHRAGRTRPL